MRFATVDTRLAGRPTDPPGSFGLRLEDSDGGLPEGGIYADVLADISNPPGSHEALGPGVIDHATGHGGFLAAIEHMPQTRMVVRWPACLEEFLGRKDRSRVDLGPANLVGGLREGELLGIGEHSGGHRGHHRADVRKLGCDLNRSGDHVGDDARAARHADNREVAHAAQQPVGAERPIQAGEQLIG